MNWPRRNPNPLGLQLHLEKRSQRKGGDLRPNPSKARGHEGWGGRPGLLASRQSLGTPTAAPVAQRHAHLQVNGGDSIVTKHARHNTDHPQGWKEGMRVGNNTAAGALRDNKPGSPNPPPPCLPYSPLRGQFSFTPFVPVCNAYLWAKTGCQGERDRVGLRRRQWTVGSTHD